MAETKMKQMMKNFSFSKNENLMVNNYNTHIAQYLKK